MATGLLRAGKLELGDDADLSIKNDTGVEYVKARDGTLDTLVDVDGTPTMSQVGAGIIESGSNANGSYIKFSDGTMECYRNFGTVNYNSAVTVAYTFPAGFVGTFPAVYACGIPASVWDTIVRGAATSLTQYNIQHWNVSGVNQNISNLSMIAIGRWK